MIERFTRAGDEGTLWNALQAADPLHSGIGDDDELSTGIRIQFEPSMEPQNPEGHVRAHLRSRSSRSPTQS